MRYDSSIPVREFLGYVFGCPLFHPDHEVSLRYPDRVATQHVVFGRRGQAQVVMFERAVSLGLRHCNKTIQRSSPTLFVSIHDPELEVPPCVARIDGMGLADAGLDHYVKVLDPRSGNYSTARHVHGETAEAARRIHTNALEPFLNARPGLCVEAAGSRILVYYHGRFFEPEEWPQVQDEALEISSLLKQAGAGPLRDPDWVLPDIGTFVVVDGRVVG